MTGSRLVVGEGAPDWSPISPGVSTPFTPAQEARLREIVREEMDLHALFDSHDEHIALERRRALIAADRVKKNEFLDARLREVLAAIGPDPLKRGSTMQSDIDAIRYRSLVRLTARQAPSAPPPAARSHSPDRLHRRGYQLLHRSIGASLRSLRQAGRYLAMYRRGAK
jgi:hypothetical protein